jgi:hypothetical protein
MIVEYTYTVGEEHLEVYGIDDLHDLTVEMIKREDTIQLAHDMADKSSVISVTVGPVTRGH